MPTWILRKNTDGERVGAPRRCAPRGVVRLPGLLTVEQQIDALLDAQESAAGAIDGQRKIYRAQQLVGYLVVLSTD